MGKRWKRKELQGLLNYDVLRLAGILYVIGQFYVDLYMKAISQSLK